MKLITTIFALLTISLTGSLATPAGDKSEDCKIAVLGKKEGLMSIFNKSAIEHLSVSGYSPYLVSDLDEVSSGLIFDWEAIPEEAPFTSVKYNYRAFIYYVQADQPKILIHESFADSYRAAIDKLKNCQFIRPQGN